jgi:mono/diheme cytochrome c family protein
VTVYVLADSTTDPVTMPYLAIGANPSTTTPIMVSGPTPAFQWSVLSSPLSTTQWRPGGLVRLRTRSRYNGSSTPADMVTFDTYGNTCINVRLAAGDTWQAAGYACQSPYPNDYITLASTETTPAEKNGEHIHYLSFRGGVPGSSALRSANQQTFGTANYYNQIGAPETLVEFKNKYGFSVGASPIRAVYYNHGDLGVARDMNCKASTIQNAAVTACFVSNFGRNPEQFPYNAAGFGPDNLAPQTALQQALGPQTQVPLGPNVPLATVAMVYNGALAAGARVQFIVYDENGALTDVAALDNEGLSAVGSLASRDLPTAANVAVPDNCLTCHGSSSAYTASASGAATVKNAHFLPFDPAGFEFSATNPSFAKQPMLDKLKQLNALVLDTAPAPATTALINGMYPSASGTGPKDPASTFSDDYIPDGWKLQTSEARAATQIYNEVVKPYCRTCHVSHDPGPYDWTTYDAFQKASDYIGFLVCTNNSIAPMPQAEQTQTRFWRSGARAHLVSAFNLGGACAP